MKRASRPLANSVWLIALAAMIGASALLAGTSLIAKALGLGLGGPSLHPLQVSAGRFGFALLTLGAIALVAPPSFMGAAWRLHISRSVCGWLGVTCMFAAAARMPLSEATAITFLSPLVTMALAALLLGERVGGGRWIAACVALGGALIMIRPGTEAFQPAATIALAAAALTGLEAIFIKRLSAREPPLRILLINNTLGATLAWIAASFVWQWPSTGQWLLLALLGNAMLLAQSLFIQAMKRGDASYVIPALYTTLVFVTLYDFALFGELPDLAAAIGAGLIVLGVMMLSLLQLRARR